MRKPIRSAINYLWSLVFGLLSFIVFGLLERYYPNQIISILSYISYYVIISSTVTFVELYEDYLRVVYPFRFLYRIKSYNYNELVKVVDIYQQDYYENPRIKLILANKKQFEWPSNTFPIFSYNKRKIILQYLKSKGVNIEIKSEFQKELDILSEN